jgi:hypothetical protein
MNATSIDIKDIIEAESSLGLTFGTNLFVGKEPTSPANCVTIFDIPGMPPQLTLDDFAYYFPSVNIRVRNVDYETGWDLINKIKVTLHGLHGEEWNETLYTLIACSGEPAHLDWDEGGRARFSANFNIQRR